MQIAEQGPLDVRAVEIACHREQGGKVLVSAEQSQTCGGETENVTTWVTRLLLVGRTKGPNTCCCDMTGRTYLTAKLDSYGIQTGENATVSAADAAILRHSRKD